MYFWECPDRNFSYKMLCEKKSGRFSEFSQSLDRGGFLSSGFKFRTLYIELRSQWWWNKVVGWIIGFRNLIRGRELALGWSGQSSSRQNVRYGPRCGPVWPVWSSVAQCVEDLAATNPSVNSCQAMDQASWPPYAFSLPIQQELEHWQEESNKKLVKNRLHSRNMSDNPCRPLD